VEEWDVTTLVFALNYSDALSGVRFGDRWTGIQNAIYKIKEVRNALFSHARKASTSPDTFKKNIEILLHAVEDLLTSSDPLFEKLQTLLNETEFPTDDLLRYKQCVREDQNSLLLLEKDVKRLEDKMKISTPTIVTAIADDTRSSETSANSKIISRIRRRMDNFEREIKIPVDLVPSRFKPEIFRNARYIRLINNSVSMYYNFRWENHERFVKEFSDDHDFKMFAGIQSAVALSYQSKKEEALEHLNALVPNVLLEKYGVVLHARIMIHKAYILHDQGKDDEAMKEADDAESLLSLGEFYEDAAEINNIKANIILSSGQNSQEDRTRILLHLDKCIHYCKKAAVDKTFPAVQATLRRALVHLGYYQHGLLEDVPKSDVDTAESILEFISKQPEPLSERGKVYYTYGRSLLAYRKGDTNVATKLEHKMRRKCVTHNLTLEIQQLDMLKTLIRSKNE